MAQSSILVIDDDPDMLDLVKSCLETIEAKFYTAECSQDAIEILKKLKGKIDMIITDYELPDANGIRLISALRKNGLKKVPIICISGYGTDEVVSQASELDIETWIHKPFKPNELLSAVEAILTFSV